MRFKKWPQLPAAGRTRAGHYHGSHTLTFPEAVLLGEMAYHPKHFCPECTEKYFLFIVKKVQRTSQKISCQKFKSFMFL